MHQRERPQDEYGKFLPWQLVNLNEEIEEEAELPISDASPIFPTKTSSRIEPLDTSGPQPFAEILVSFLYTTIPNPLAVTNLVSNIPFQ